MTRILIAHPGAMGSAVGAALVSAGHEACWLPAGRSPDTRRRAEEAGLTPLEGADGCEIVISICPPSAALDTARAFTPSGGIYVDANAISPATAREVATIAAAGGAAYVDGGIIGSPPEPGGNTRLYLSGQRADEVARLFDGTALEASVLPGEETAASALKMSYAAWTKISAALLLSVRETAAALGVEEALVAEWELSQPQLAPRYAAAQRSAETKGWRWVGEMEEIAATFESVGQPTGFGDAAASVYSAYSGPTGRVSS